MTRLVLTITPIPQTIRSCTATRAETHGKQFFDIVGAAWSTVEFIANPSLSNAVNLLWDVGSIFIPFVPGSYISKAGKPLVSQKQLLM